MFQKPEGRMICNVGHGRVTRDDDVVRLFRVELEQVDCRCDDVEFVVLVDLHFERRFVVDVEPPPLVPFERRPPS